MSLSVNNQWEAVILTFSGWWLANWGTGAFDVEAAVRVWLRFNYVYINRREAAEPGNITDSTDDPSVVVIGGRPFSNGTVSIASNPPKVQSLLQA